MQLKRASRPPSKLNSLKYILPKAYREEVIGDLMEIQQQMQKEGYSKWWTWAILLGNLCSVGYHMIMFKMKEMFSTTKQREIGK